MYIYTHTHIYLKPHTTACFSHPTENLAEPRHAVKQECTTSTRTLCLCHGWSDHGLPLSTQESIVLTSPFQDVNTSRVTVHNLIDTNQFIATHNLMGPRRYWWIYWSSKQLKDTTKDMGISVRVWSLCERESHIKRGSWQWSQIDQWESHVMSISEGHHTAGGWSLRTTLRPMSPSGAPQHSEVPAASHLSLQKRFRTTTGNYS